MQKNSNQQWPRGIWGTFTESAYSQIQRVKWSVAQSSLKDARLWGSGHHCVINHVINHCSPLSPRWRRRGLVVQAPLGDASASSVVSWIHTLYLYFIICIRYPVNATCEPWLCCSVPCMRHLLHVCLSWESDLTSCFFHLFFYPALKGFFLNWIVGISFTVQTVKPTAAMWLWFWAIGIKRIWCELVLIVMWWEKKTSSDKLKKRRWTHFWLVRSMDPATWRIQVIL